MEKRNVLDPEFAEAAEKVVTKTAEVLEKACEFASEVEADEPLRKLYSAAHATLKHRIAILEFAYFPGDKQTVGTADKHNDHKRIWEAEQAKSRIKDKVTSSKEPMENLHAVPSLSCLLYGHAVYEIHSDDDVKIERKRLKALRDTFLAWVGKVSAQHSSLRQMFARKKQALQSEQDKKRQQQIKDEQQQKKRSAAEAKLASNESLRKVAKNYVIMSIPDDHAAFIQMPEIANPTEAAELAKNHDEPVLFKHVVNVVQALENVKDEFLLDFRKDKDCYDGPGRGSKMLTENTGDLRTQMADFGKFGARCKSKLRPGEKEWLDNPWSFAYSPCMRSSGAEYGFCGSVNLSGSRRVRIASYQDLAVFMGTT